MTLEEIYREVFEGYHDGSIDSRVEEPTSLANRSRAYRFGWRNGRDDRRNNPRAPADELRAELREIEAEAVR